jgi:hypothetical protein
LCHSINLLIPRPIKSINSRRLIDYSFNELTTQIE